LPELTRDAEDAEEQRRAPAPGIETLAEVHIPTYKMPSARSDA